MSKTDKREKDTGEVQIILNRHDEFADAPDELRILAKARSKPRAKTLYYAGDSLENYPRVIKSFVNTSGAMFWLLILEVADGSIPNTSFFRDEDQADEVFGEIIDRTNLVKA